MRDDSPLTRPPADATAAEEELIVQLDAEGLVVHTTHPPWAAGGLPDSGEPLAACLVLDGAALPTLLKRSRERGRSARLTGRLVRSGTPGAVAGRLVPLAGPTEHRGWLLVLRPEADVPTRILEASPSILIRAVEQSSLGFTLSGRDGKIVYTNLAEAAMHGYSREDLIGRRARDLGAPSTDEPPPKSRTDSLWVRRRTNRRKDGSLFPVRLISDDLRDEEGRLLGRLTISEDISEHARLERMKGEFLRVVGHELRTPLTSILASLALLRRNPEGAVVPEEALAIAERNSRHLLSLVHDLLDLQKAASGDLKMELRPVPVLPLLREAAERAVEDRAQRSALVPERVQVDARRGDPGDAAAAAVLADRDRLLQVLDQLISNALKFSPSDQPVHLQAMPRDGGTALAVIDRGPGLPEEHRRRLVEPFAQADGSTTRSTSGAGLGLSLAKALTEGMGGEIEIVAPSGDEPRGSTVLVHLPNA